MGDIDVWISVSTDFRLPLIRRQPIQLQQSPSPTLMHTLIPTRTSQLKNGIQPRNSVWVV